RVNLYSVPVAGGLPKPISKGGAITQIHAAADFIVFSKGTLTAAPDLFRIALDGSAPTQLTTENAAWLSSIAAPTYESLTVKGAAGASIQYWLLKPPNFDASK